MTAWRKDRNGWLVLVFQFPDPRRPGHNVRVRHALNLRSSTDNDKIAERVKREVEALRALGRFDEIVAKFPTCRVFRKLGLLPEPVAQKPTLGALCTEWLEQKRTHGRSNATIATYAYLLKRVLSDALAAKRCDLVTAGDIEGLIERLRGRVAELADAADLKSAAERRAGSTPAVPTIPAGQINRIVWILSSAYAMGEKRHELTRNPARLVERMDAQHKRPTDPFSADEVKKILEAANDTKIRSSSTQIDGGESRFRDSAERIRRDCPPIGGKVGTSQSYNLVIVAIGTGMRVGELFGLKWPAINFDGNYIDVVETHGRYGANKPKTAGSLRRLDMSASVRAALISQRALSIGVSLVAEQPVSNRQDAKKTGETRPRVAGMVRLPHPAQKRTDIVFPSRALTPMRHENFGKGQWRELLERAGVPYRPFGKCRHTFAVLMREQMGAQDREIARQLGHTTLDMMINHYLRWSPDRQGKAADVIANLGTAKARKAK